MKINGRKITVAEIRAGGAMIVLAFTAAVSITSALMEVRAWPARMASMEESVMAVVVSNDTLVQRLDRQDRRSWRIFCVVDMMAKGTPLGPLDCDPDQRELHDEQKP